MWQNIKYYLLAYAAMATGSMVSTALQLLAAEFPTGHPVSALAANLSGITVGGIFMVIGFLKDNRLQQERERTDRERERADQERERADYAIAELNRLRTEYENATKALIQRLEELNGHRDPREDPDDE